MAYETELEQIANRRNLEHWVCFDCRKMFKRRARPENVASGPFRSALPYRCPDCHEPMRDMGICFEPPRRTNLAAWGRMKVLADYNHGFYSPGWKKYVERELVGSPPLNPNALRRLFIQNRQRDEIYNLRRDARHLKELKRYKAWVRRRYGNE